MTEEIGFGGGTMKMGIPFGPTIISDGNSPVVEFTRETGGSGIEWDAAVKRVQGLPLSVTATQVTGIIAAADALADAAYQILVTGEPWTPQEAALWDTASAYRKARGEV